MGVDKYFQDHAVVIVSRTSCPYSKAVKGLLIGELSLKDLNVLEIDQHPEGAAILQAAKEITGLKTVPQVFVDGKFVGNHDKIMLMDKNGELEPLVSKYMTGPRKAPTFAAPLFWYPATVGKNAVRATGVLSFVVSSASAALLLSKDSAKVKNGGYLAAFLCGDYALRILGGAKFSPVSKLGALLASPYEVIPRPGAPKQFAALSAYMLTQAGSALFFVGNSPEWAGGVMGFLAIGTSLEGFADFCLGCVFYDIGQKIFGSDTSAKKS